MLYKKIDANSVNAISSALNFFETPPTNVAISNGAYREFLTLNPLSYHPFLFKIHPMSSFIDPSKIFIYTEMQIKKVAAGGNLVALDADDRVAPIQYIGATFIRNLKIAINQREIFDSNSLYAYKAYLDAELSYPAAVKDSFLSVCGYSRDAADQNVINGQGCVNRKRRFLNGNNQPVQFISKLDTDLFNQDLFLINNVEIDIEIWPHGPDFCLICPVAPLGEVQPRYTIDITACKLYVKTIDLMDGLSLDIAKTLALQPARYGIRKTMLKSLFLTEGRTEFSYSLFTEEIPRRVLIAMVDSEAYNGNTGNPHLSPFNFKPFGCRQINLCASGRDYPQVHYELDFPNSNYARAYHDLMEHLGQAYSTESCGINYAMYGEGWTIFSFMLTNSGENDECFQLIKDGTTSLYMRFATPIPPGGVTLLAYAEYDAMILIDKNRAITSDITV